MTVANTPLDFYPPEQKPVSPPLIVHFSEETQEIMETIVYAPPKKVELKKVEAPLKKVILKKTVKLPVKKVEIK